MATPGRGKHPSPGIGEESPRPSSVEADSRWTSGVRMEERGVPVEGVMTREVVTLAPRDQASEAARQMRDENIGFLPVCQPDGSVVGVLTDRDLVVRLLAEGSPASTPVEELMTSDVISCYAGDDLAVAERLMRDNEIVRVVVLGDDQRLAGVLSLSDLAEYEEECRVGQIAADVDVREVDPR